MDVFLDEAYRVLTKLASPDTRVVESITSKWLIIFVQESLFASILFFVLAGLNIRLILSTTSLAMEAVAEASVSSSEGEVGVPVAAGATAALAEPYFTNRPSPQRPTTTRSFPTLQGSPI